MNKSQSEAVSYEYFSCLENYLKAVKNTGLDVSRQKLEFQFESFRDWSVVNTFDEVENWYKEKLDNVSMTVSVIPLSECRDWAIKDGIIYHKSKDFFTIEGLRVENTKDREVGEAGWDQPIIKQVGWDGGILGIIRKRINGVPHYLIEAKSEPGNPNLIQMSPTLQATFSNINKSHKGRAPNYLDFFESPEKYNAIVHYKQWLAEDGGRFFNKRNLNMLVELPEEQEVEIENNSFVWMSLYQIKKCLLRDSWVNPHIRGIISHL
jgi:oxidase EvaA